VAQGGLQPAQQPTVSRLSHSRWMQSWRKGWHG